MKTFLLLLIFGLILSPHITLSNSELDTSSIDLNDIDIIILISDICGWSYFVVNETLHEMGVNVITITNTESYTVTTCPNKEPRPITADLLLSEVNLATIDTYDGIIIPSGRQWQFLMNDSDVHELLQVAYNSGLAIGSICNGGLVIGNSSIVTNGTMITRPLPEVHQLLKDRGAIILSRANVVSDRRIISSDIGSGPPTGHEAAPNYEVCLEMVKAIKGLSYIANTKVEVISETNNFEYSITSDIANLTQQLIGFNISNIHEITANIYPELNSTDITEVELSYIQDTNQYAGTFMVSDTGRYIIDLVVLNEELSYEIVRTATTFTAGDESSFLTLILLGGGIGGIVVVVLLIFWKRKK